MPEAAHSQEEVLSTDTRLFNDRGDPMSSPPSVEVTFSENEQHLSSSRDFIRSLQSAVAARAGNLIYMLPESAAIHIDLTWGDDGPTASLELGRSSYRSYPWAKQVEIVLESIKQVVESLARANEDKRGQADFSLDISLNDRDPADLASELNSPCFEDPYRTKLQVRDVSKELLLTILSRKANRGLDLDVTKFAGVAVDGRVLIHKKEQGGYELRDNAEQFLDDLAGGIGTTDDIAIYCSNENAAIAEFISQELEAYQVKLWEPGRYLTPHYQDIGLMTKQGTYDVLLVTAEIADASEALRVGSFQAVIMPTEAIIIPDLPPKETDLRLRAVPEIEKLDPRAVLIKLASKSGNDGPVMLIPDFKDVTVLSDDD